VQHLPLISQDNYPAGVSTATLLPVAGRHRASPSTTLDKKLIFFSDNTIINWLLSRKKQPLLTQRTR